MFKKFDVKLTLIRDQLGTNPCDPNVLDKHIIERQRKLILEKSKINSEVNKYLDAIDISKEKSKDEIQKLVDRLEALTGLELTDDDKKKIASGDLEGLKETFASLKTTGTTIFFWDKEKDLPCIGDHMIYGFLKAAAEAIGRSTKKKNGTPLYSASYTQSLVNQHVRCEDQFITFDGDVKYNEDESPYFLQRPLRAMTAQGPRISLAKSEVVPAGRSLNFTLKVLAGSPLIKVIDKDPDFTKTPLEHLFDYGQMSGLGQWRNAGYGQFTYEMISSD